MKVTIRARGKGGGGDQKGYGHKHAQGLVGWVVSSRSVKVKK